MATLACDLSPLLQLHGRKWSPTKSELRHRWVRDLRRNPSTTINRINDSGSHSWSKQNSSVPSHANDLAHCHWGCFCCLRHREWSVDFHLIVAPEPKTQSPKPNTKTEPNPHPHPHSQTPTADHAPTQGDTLRSKSFTLEREGFQRAKAPSAHSEKCLSDGLSNIIMKSILKVCIAFFSVLKIYNIILWSSF